MFGVLDTPEYSGVNAGVRRPIINDGKDEQANLGSDDSTMDMLLGFIPAVIRGPLTDPMQVKHRIRTRTNTCVAC